MHPSAMACGAEFFECYGSNLPATGRLLEVGSQNVNGSLRDVAPSTVEYLGVDFSPGRGVDVVIDDPYALPFEDDTFDVLVSSSCLEHSEFFWMVIIEMFRVCKPQGVIYVNAPSNGAFHRYPVDCWRFYPDSGQAMVRWAQRSQYPRAALLESFTNDQLADRMDDWWNDFVCVMIKDSEFSGLYPDRILHTKSNFTNGICPAISDEILNRTRFPEDQQERLRGSGMLTP